MTNHPLIVSYFTPGTAYETRAARLKASVDRLGLESRIEPRAAKGSWVENCAQKAIFVKEVRERERRPILWVDADAIIRRPLLELVDCSADLALVKRNGWHFSGGQIFFAHTAGADTVIDIWCRYCEKFPHIYDQVSLGYAWWDTALTPNPPTVQWLNEAILQIEERRLLNRLSRKLFSKAAILHKQESRQSRELQTVPEKEPFRSKHLPDWWKGAARKNQPFPISRDQRLELGLG
ncbi:hypothetical protein [Mesorhizobium sp. M0684]|uniref:hypothetical protein n=1 Tax=unclassified Mesorhizobium TaxID=325217 RepID=UPI00333C60C1